MASERAQEEAKRRLAALDAEADKIKRNKLIATATMGSREARKKASSDLGSLPRQRVQARFLREEEEN